MTVGELIAELQKEDPALPIFLRDYEGFLGHPYSSGTGRLDAADSRWIGLPQGTDYVHLSLEYR